MKILITGGTGFIGRQVCRELTGKGHELTIQSRNPAVYLPTWGLDSHFLKWNMNEEDCPISLDPYDAIIHLAGASIAGGLWTTAQKGKIFDSRLASTRALGQALSLRLQPLPCFISAAAIGIYGSDSDQTFDETSSAGEGFLAEVCLAWESAVAALPNVAREVRLRFGLVLGAEGGYLERIAPATRFGLGAVLGDGRQWISWIHRDDVVGVIKHALRDSAYSGPINVVAPEALRQSAFQKLLAHRLRTRVILRVPKALLKVALGEFSHLLLDSQKVLPRRLLQLQYPYHYPALDSALEEALSLNRKSGM